MMARETKSQYYARMDFVACRFCLMSNANTFTIPAYRDVDIFEPARAIDACEPVETITATRAEMQPYIDAYRELVALGAEFDRLIEGEALEGKQ